MTAPPTPDHAPDGPPALRFAVLGPLRAWHGERHVPLSAPRTQAVLAALVLRAGRTASARELIGAVWGDDAPPSAAGALRTHICGLRRLLEPGRGPHARARVLVSADGGYALRPESGALDLAVFEQHAADAGRARAAGRLEEARELLDSALALWAGAPLAGVPGPYAHAERGRLTERRLTVLEERWEVETELGGHTAAIAALGVLAAEHPWRERIQELLMTALYRAGRQADALEVYARARRSLADQLGVEPGPGLAGLQRRVLAAEPGPADPVGLLRLAATSPLPAQLPYDTDDFTGREEGIARLCAALDSGRIVALSAISGMGGVGKTTLAVHVAHRTRDRFPDGQLYADLRGTDPRPAEPMHVLDRFLRALGVPAGHVPALPDERAALYRSRLAGRRVLVVLDNARDLAQIRDLLPGSPGTAVLLTSRSRLAGLTGATLVDLRPMGPREALALLARIVGEERVNAEPKAAAEVVESCGGLPLALRIVAARLAAGPDRTLAQTAVLLADERRRLRVLRAEDAAVETTFRLGAGLLDGEQSRAFRLLALPDVPEMTLPEAVAVLDRPWRVAEELCEALVDLNLLESLSPGRYRYHDLLRLFARQAAVEETPESERTAALTRLLHFLLSTARNAHRTTMPDDVFPGFSGDLAPPRSAGLAFATQQEAAGWLVDTQASLLGVIEQGARDGRVPLAVCADLLVAVDPLGRVGARPYGLERAARAVCEAAERAGDTRAEARARYMLGGAVSQRFELGPAVPEFERVVELCRAAGDRALLGPVLIALGGCALARRDFTAAHDMLTEALALSRAVHSRGSEAYALGFLALARLATGEPEEAVATGREAVALTRATGDRAGEANALHNLAQVCLWTGRTEESLDCLHESLRLWRETGSLYRESLLLGALAQAYNFAGRPAEAAEHAETARDIAERHGDGYFLGRALAQLGHAHAAQGRPAEATVCFRKAHDIFRGLGLPDADDLAPHLTPGAG
ncbi:BTAD domain-containing putative transcriptional regulator [Streptomyces syringium]|uniref:AfsR/SARP family transcriptional regulator n=1 Tax=Streptomyces syringium TaxID=76729 RepID=UPI0033AC0B6F